MAKKVTKNRVIWQLPFERKNFIILLAGFVTILLGFGLMATGITDEPAVVNGTWNNALAVYIAPTLLIIGYCIVIPYGIIKFYGKNKENSGQN